MHTTYLFSKSTFSFGVFNFEMNRVGPGVEGEGPYIKKLLNKRNDFVAYLCRLEFKIWSCCM